MATDKMTIEFTIDTPEVRAFAERFAALLPEDVSCRFHDQHEGWIAVTLRVPTDDPRGPIRLTTAMRLDSEDDLMQLTVDSIPGEVEAYKRLP